MPTSGNPAALRSFYKVTRFAPGDGLRKWNRCLLLLAGTLREPFDALLWAQHLSQSKSAACRSLPCENSRKKKKRFPPCVCVCVFLFDLTTRRVARVACTAQAWHVRPARCAPSVPRVRPTRSLRAAKCAAAPEAANPPRARRIELAQAEKLLEELTNHTRSRILLKIRVYRT